MDHVGPWLFVAILLFGSVARLLRGARGLAERSRGTPPAAPAASPHPSSMLAELQRNPAWRGVVPPTPPPTTGPRAPGSANVRVTAPTRRVPMGAARADGPPYAARLGGGPLLDELAAGPSAGGRAVGEALAHRASLRNAVVLAEVLAPPVALR
jgi:hypothetical protein